MVGPGVSFTRWLLVAACTLWPGELLLDVSIHPWLWLCYELHECAVKAVQNLAFINYVSYALDPF
jgi:hypothetical protein